MSSRLFPLFKTCIFSTLITIMHTSHAEYYLVNSMPACDTCTSCMTEIETCATPCYRPKHHCHHRVRHVHHRRHHACPVRHVCPCRAEVAVTVCESDPFCPCNLGPATCSSCGDYVSSTWRTSSEPVYVQPASARVVEYTDFDWDRRTMDDVGAELNIDY